MALILPYNNPFRQIPQPRIVITARRNQIRRIGTKSTIPNPALMLAQRRFQWESRSFALRFPVQRQWIRRADGAETAASHRGAGMRGRRLQRSRRLRLGMRMLERGVRVGGAVRCGAGAAGQRVDSGVRLILAVVVLGVVRGGAAAVCAVDAGEAITVCAAGAVGRDGGVDAPDAGGMVGAASGELANVGAQ